MLQDEYLKKVAELAHFSAAQVAEARQLALETQQPLFELLKERYKVTESVITQARAAVLRLPVAEIRPEGISQQALNLIPEEIVDHYQIIPLGEKAGVLEVGLVNPESIDAEEALDFIATSRGVKIKKFLLLPSQFEKARSQYVNAKVEVKEALASLSEKFTKDVAAASDEEEELKVKGRTVELAEQAPISKVVKVILRYAVESKASDIHIEPTTDQVKVRFRVDGSLHTSLFLPKSILPAIISRIKILSVMKIDETRIPQDGRIHTLVSNRLVDFRVSTFPTTEGEKVVLRVLDTSAGIPSLEDLGLQGKSLEDVRKAMAAPFGTALITGPTGSGKSTTLYSILGQLNQDDVNIVTLEDPVEYYMSGIAQSQVRPEIGYSFGSGLRHILRQDPDIIMVGEIRDEETAGLAVHAALTGHLVFSTLHTNDAIGVIPRLVDMGVQSFLVSASLKLAVAQRLVGRLCLNCRETYAPDEGLIKFIKESLTGVSLATMKTLKIEPPFTLSRAKGCPQCGNRGTKGRLAVFETLYMTPELQAIMTKEPTEHIIRQEAVRQGTVSMRQDGILKALQGYVSLEEVVKATEDAEKSLRRQLTKDPPAEET